MPIRLQLFLISSFMFILKLHIYKERYIHNTLFWVTLCVTRLKTIICGKKKSFVTVVYFVRVCLLYHPSFFPQSFWISTYYIIIDYTSDIILFCFVNILKNFKSMQMLKFFSLLLPIKVLNAPTVMLTLMWINGWKKIIYFFFSTSSCRVCFVTLSITSFLPLLRHVLSGINFLFK